MSCGLGEGTHHFACDCREEAFRKLAEAATVAHDELVERYNHGMKDFHVRHAIDVLDQALKSYATPGHSPEGKAQ